MEILKHKFIDYLNLQSEIYATTRIDVNVAGLVPRQKTWDSTKRTGIYFIRIQNNRHDITCIILCDCLCENSGALNQR